MDAIEEMDQDVEKSKLAGRCWFRHRWTKWTEVTMCVRWVWETEWVETLKQRRQCTRCGRTQIASLTS